MLNLAKCSMCDSEVDKEDQYCPYCGETIASKNEIGGEKNVLGRRR